MVYKAIELELAEDKLSDTVSVSFDEKPGIRAIANTAVDARPLL